MRDFSDLTDRIREFVDEHGVGNPVFAAIAALRKTPLRPIETIRADTVSRRPARRASVAVVIPCYNYAHYLPGAVASVLDQHGVDVQVVIVNDRSPDTTADVADQLAATDPRVVAVHNAENLGHVRTFNEGMKRVKAEFLVRLDADDLLTPGCLARAVALFDHAPALGLVYGHPYPFASVDPPAPRVRKVSWTVWSGPEWLAERCRRAVNCITTPEAMLRMSVVDQVGPLDTRLRFAQDMEMWCRVAAVSDVGRVRGADQALHRDHPKSMSATDGSPAIVDLQERRQVFASVFESTGASLRNAPVLHLLARKALALESVGYAERALNSGSAESATQFLEFAEETCPSVLDSGWPADVVRRSHGLAKLSTVRLLQRRMAGLGRELDYVRWTVDGI